MEPGGRKRRIKQPPTRIRIDNEHKVMTTSTHKFLGVLLDDELRFQKHAVHALGKGEQWTSQVKHLSKVMKGMRGMHTWQLYYSVALLSMLYAVDVWCTQSLERKGRKAKRGMWAAIRKLESVQRKAALQTTGALRTTLSDLLFSHADMLPLSVHIKLRCQQAALQIVTLPKMHPLYSTAKKTSGRRVKRHLSPLHDILQVARIRINDIETIGTLPKPPTWRNRMQILTQRTGRRQSRWQRMTRVTSRYTLMDQVMTEV